MVFFLRKLQCAVLVRFSRYPKICSFSDHGLFMNLNQPKIIYRLKYKTSNFEKLEFLVIRKLRHFKFAYYRVTEANFQVPLGLKKFLIDPNTTSSYQKFDRKTF